MIAGNGLEMKYNRHGSLLEKSFCFLYQKEKDVKLEVSWVGVRGCGLSAEGWGSVASSQRPMVAARLSHLLANDLNSPASLLQR